jgi:hypothetical protein
LAAESDGAAFAVAAESGLADSYPAAIAGAIQKTVQTTITGHSLGPAFMTTTLSVDGRRGHWHPLSRRSRREGDRGNVPIHASISVGVAF